MGTVSLIRVAAILFYAAILSACSGGQRDPVPHWAEFPTPRYDKVGRAIIVAPHGYRLCSTADSFSNLLWLYVPLDRKVRCQHLPKTVDWEQMPDFIVIGTSPDAPMKYESTEDFVGDESFYCHGMSYAGRRPISNAPTSIGGAGKILAGLDTAVCVREDQENDRYSKAYLAYRPDPNFIGRSYLIAAYVRLENKRKADELLEQIVREFKLLQ